jgi:hypothetical protein
MVISFADFQSMSIQIVMDYFVRKTVTQFIFQLSAQFAFAICLGYHLDVGRYVEDLACTVAVNVLISSVVSI